MPWDFNLAFMPYGPYWRAHRRVFHQYMNQTVIDEYLPAQVRETRRFLRRALDTTPGRFGEQIRLFVS